jgi:hypothetical protein
MERTSCRADAVKESVSSSSFFLLISAPLAATGVSPSFLGVSPLPVLLFDFFSEAIWPRISPCFCCIAAVRAAI